MSPTARARRWMALGVTAIAWSCVDGLPTQQSAPQLAAPVRFALEAQQNISTDEQDALGDAFDRLDQIRVQLFRDGATEPFVDTLVTVQPGRSAYIIDLTVDVEDATLAEVIQVAITGSAGGVELFSASGEISVRAGDTGRGLGGSGGSEPLVALSVRYTGPGLRGRVVGPDGQSAMGVPVTLEQSGAVVQSTTTTVDGDYLFTDLEPGRYRVRTQPDPGLVSCPATRDIGPVTDGSSLVGGFRLSRGGCDLRVLVLSGGDIDDAAGVAGALSSALPEGVLGSFFVVVDPPSLSTLRGYDVVLLYENGPYDDANRVGDRVAEYVGEGGNLVIGSFYWQNRSDGPFGTPGWGALEAIDPLAAGGATQYSPGTLGSITPHAITSGVSAFTVSRWWGGASAKGGTDVVATWTDGTPLAGHRTMVGGQRIVAISAFPGLLSQCCTTGDFATLWVNALRWAGAAGGPPP